MRGNKQRWRLKNLDSNAFFNDDSQYLPSSNREKKFISLSEPADTAAMGFYRDISEILGRKINSN